MLRGRAEREQVVFLVQGNFAAYRGYEELVAAWSGVDEQAQLLLRGPDNPYKQTIIDLARSLKLLDRSVFFSRAVSEDELITTAREADVGIIPYQPRT